MAALAAMAAAVEFLRSSIFLLIISSASSQSSDEKVALLELKRSFSDPHRILSSWDYRSSNHCSWSGVSCDSDFRVSRLKIGGNFSRFSSCSIEYQAALHGFGIWRNCSDQSEISGGLRGRLSAVVGKLAKLRVLSLSFSGIGGEIPHEIWGLRNLEVLDLEGNAFLGNLSGFDFSGLRRLRVLNLAYNKIFGMFPPSLSECKGLRVLNMAGNGINDVVPKFVAGFSKLRVLNLSSNLLVGYIPSNFRSDCGNLEHLDLSNNFLKGEIPRALGNCGHLRTILLSSNSLRGVMPSEIGKLRKLEVLNVARNRLSGPLSANLGNCTRLSILVLSSPRGRAPHGPSDDLNSFEGFSVPEEITSLPDLRILWAPNANLEGRFPRKWGSCKWLKMVNLARNRFTGDILGIFAECSDLQYLNLSSNRLRGRLDEDLESSCVKMLDFSGNMFSGPIPSFDTNICENRYDSFIAYLSFLAKMAYDVQIMDSDVSLEVVGMTSTLGVIQSPEKMDAPLPKGDFDLKEKDHGLSTLVVASMASAFILVIATLALLALFCYSKKKEVMTRIEVSPLPQTEKVVLFNDIGLTSLTYDAIVEATENFHRRNCIGNGGFGKTYRAEIAPGRDVAIKRLTAERHQGAAQFHAEVATLGQIKHPNLITLLGYYSCGPEMLLIYNYLPGGNLDRFIKDRARRMFNYAVIHKIAIHVASALSYLHDQCVPKILHRDIKPSNILLDANLNAFLSDFGLSKILTPEEDDDGATTRVAGTYGYIAPEYASTGRVSDRVDVYSYGVVLLELMSEKRVLDPSFYSHRDGFNIVSWACMMLDRGEAGAVFAEGLWEAGPREKLVKMLHVAVMCTVDEVEARPSMVQVVQRLKQIRPSSGEH